MILEFNAPGYHAKLAALGSYGWSGTADELHRLVVGFDYRRQLPPGEIHEESHRTRLAGP